VGRTPAAGPAPPAGQKIKVFDELLLAISGANVAANNSRYDLTLLMPQIVPGHRLWVEGNPAADSERFVALQRIKLWQDRNQRQIWLRLYLFADDLKRINLGHQEFLQRSQMDADFHEVATAEVIGHRSLMCLEQLNPITYGHRPSDAVPELVTGVRHRLWRTVLNAPPYRRYYCYPAPAAEHARVLPQILSIYAITFYLGSIVRYRPHHFDSILRSSYGPFIEAFLNDQPWQFAYLMASEFAEKEVTKAGIV
jgi:hypothetical protein